MAIDCQVGSVVPELEVFTGLSRNLVRLTSGYVLQKKVVELMFENPSLFIVRQLLEECRIVQHLEGRCFRVDLDCCGRNRCRCALLNVARYRREERLIHQKPRYVLVQIESHGGTPYLSHYIYMVLEAELRVKYFFN